MAVPISWGSFLSTILGLYEGAFQRGLCGKILGNGRAMPWAPSKEVFVENVRPCKNYVACSCWIDRSPDTQEDRQTDRQTGRQTDR